MTHRFFVVAGSCIGFLFLILSSLCLADDIKADSKISQVTIFPGAAIVTKEAQVEVPTGASSVLFENIVPQIDENTLTVKGQGTAEVKIFGASIKAEYTTQASDERVKALQAQIEGVDDEIIGQNNKAGILNNQKEYLESVKLFAGQQIPKDLVTKTPSVADLDGVGNYLTKGFSELSLQAEGIRLKLRDLNRKKEALNAQLQQLNTNSQNVKRSIAVEIEAIRPGKLTLMVSYLVNNVNWEPLYDARVAFEENQVDLALFGLVSQSTGEDWKDVDLTISTARPSIGGVMPELSIWTLSPWEGLKEITNAPMAAGLGSIDNSSVNLLREAEQKERAGVAYAQSEVKGISVVFKITKPMTIKSDGTQQRVPITVLTLPAKFEYASTPKLSTYAYLRSQVENNQEATLLPGRVNVFLDGDYVGVSAIPKALGHKEKFDLYLGADEGVTVKRELLEQKSEDILFANIPSPNKTDRYSYKITIENYKNKPITLNLFDQIPVSTDEKIKVKNIKFSPEATQKDYKDRKGVELWTMTLGPQEKKEISYSFAVERPRNLNISGL